MQHLDQVIEAIFFASDKPLTIDRLFSLLKEGLGQGDQVEDKGLVKEAVLALQSRYPADGIIQLKEVASGFRFQINTRYTPWIKLLHEERSSRYSRALLETLAIIAYRQPITRGEIEDIRGVAVSSSIIKTLQEREWVRIIGYKDVPGRPALYSTTRQFLDYFDLKSLEQLPPLAEVRDLDELTQSLESGIDKPFIKQRTAKQTDGVDQTVLGVTQNHYEMAEVAEVTPENTKETRSN